MSLHRLRTDFQFAVLILFCAVAILGVGPFAVYRLVHGELMAGLIDTVIVLALLLAIAHAWRGGRLERASMVVVATGLVGGIVVGYVVGLPGVLWSYTVVLANFLLVGRLRALVASAVLIVALMLEEGPFDSLLERLMYLGSAVVTCLLAYMFARRTQMQHETLERLASRDPLTGVGNRRAMENELHIAAEAFRRHRTPAGLAVLDLDHFKRVNDEHGHEAGDHVLVDFSRIVQARCRAGDRLFRYGGEEFVLLLPGTDVAAMRPLADELCAAVAARLRAGGEPVTVSIGAAVLRADEDVAQWLARADAAMYEAKHRGRNRAVVDDEPASAP